MHSRTLTQLAQDLAARRFSATELTRHCLERIERFDGELNAFVTVTEEQALAQAAAADKRLARGGAPPLTGIPIAHKDIFCTSGVKRSEEHTSELQSLRHLVCRLLLEKK